MVLCHPPFSRKFPWGTFGSESMYLYVQLIINGWIVSGLDLKRDHMEQLVIQLIIERVLVRSLRPVFLPIYNTSLFISCSICSLKCDKNNFPECKKGGREEEDDKIDYMN